MEALLREEVLCEARKLFFDHEENYNTVLCEAQEAIF